MGVHVNISAETLTRYLSKALKKSSSEKQRNRSRTLLSGWLENLVERNQAPQGQNPWEVKRPCCKTLGTLGILYPESLYLIISGLMKIKSGKLCLFIITIKQCLLYKAQFSESLVLQNPILIISLQFNRHKQYYQRYDKIFLQAESC